MKHKVSQKALAILLAVLLALSTSIGALAAGRDLTAAEGAKDCPKFDITVSDSFGLDATVDDPDEVDEEFNPLKTKADNPYVYNSISASAWSNLFTANSKTKPADKVAYVEGAYTGAKTTSVAKDGYVYVGVRGTIENPDRAKGLSKYIVVLTYDSSILEPVTAAASKTNKVGLVGNPVVSAADLVGSSSAILNAGYGGKGASISIGNPTTTPDGSLGAVAVTVEPQSTANYLIPTQAHWDFVLPFKAKAATTTPTEINCAVTTAVGSTVSVAEMSLVANGSKALQTLDASTEMKAVNSTTNTTHFISSGATVTVTSNDASVSIPANTVKAKTTGRTLDVTVDSKGNFKDGGTFKILESSDGTNFTDSSIAVSSVTVSSNKKTATLTFDGTNLDKAKTYKIQVSSDAVDAVSPATVPATMLTGTFTACDPLGGTPSITGTTYGDTIKATLASGNSTNLTYAWSVGDTFNPNSKYSTSASGVDAATYMKAAGFTLGTSKMTFRITATDLDDTFKDVTTSAAIAKKSISVPSTVTGVPAVTQGSTGAALTVSGSVKLTTGIVGSDTVNVAYTATYPDATNAGTVNNIPITWGAVSGDQAARYNVDTTVSSTGTGSVSEAGYTVSATAPVSITSGLTGGKVGPAGGKIQGTVTLQPGETLNAVNITGDNGFTAATATITDATTGAFEYTFAATTKAIAITVAADITRGATPVTVTVSKKYDGTPDVDLEHDTITLSNGLTLTDFGVTAMTFADGEVGAGKAITTTPATVANITKDDVEYKFPESLTGTITQNTATTVKATVEGLKEGATADEIATAILGADVMVDNITVAQGKVSDYATKEDIINELEKDSTIFTAGNKTVTEITDLTQSAADVTPAKIGDTIVITGVDVTEQLADVEGLTATFADNKTTIEVTGADIAETTIDLTPADDTDAITVKIAAATGLEQGTDDEWTITAGDITVTLANITASGKFAMNFDNANFNLAVTASIGRKSSGSGIPYDTKGYAVAGMDEVEVDEENKITSLTEVTDIVKGAVFTGWSTDGTKDHIVKVGYQFKENELENGLTAVFEGYMMGDNKGKVNAEKSVTRAELLKMLLVSSGKFDATKNYDYSKTEGFKDVKKDSTAWYVPYLACNLELSEDQRVIKGFEDGTFHPDDKVTREQAAVMIARAFGVKTEGATTTKVTDIDKIPSWARESVAAMCENGTINGFPDGTFRGGVSTARCQAAHMVNPYLGLEKADEKTIRDDATVKNPFPDLSKNHWAYHDLMFASLSVKSDYYQTEITIPGAAPAAPETPAE